MILSGAVSHVSRYVDPGVQRSLAPAPALGVYGPCPAECDLLDGLFLACRRDALGYSQEASDLGLPPSGSGSGSEPTPKTQHPTPSLVRFDERFRFHLYDLDFCRAASRAGLRLGTWPILVSHGSGGNFDTEEFRATARLYLDKWEARFVAEREVKAESKKQKAPDPDPDPNGFQLSAFSFRPPAARAESTSASTGTLAVELAP